MKLKYLFFLFLIISCSVNKMSSKSSSEQTYYGLKEFDMEAFKGKWLTTSKNDLKSYRVFNENFEVINEKFEKSNYLINKDSIKIFYRNKTIKEKLIYLTDQEVRIIWGNSEEISYYRPRNCNKNIVRRKVDSIQAFKEN